MLTRVCHILADQQPQLPMNGSVTSDISGRNSEVFQGRNYLQISSHQPLIFMFGAPIYLFDLKEKTELSS